MKFVPKQIFHSKLCCIQHQKHMLGSFKVVYHPTFSFKTAFRMLILMFSNVGTSAQRFLLKTTTRD